MEKRSRRRVPELVTRPAFQGLSENEIGRARISMMASNATFRSRAGYKAQDLSRPAAGPYRRIIRVGTAYTSKRKDLRCQTATSCAFGDKALFWQVSRLKRTSVAARAEQPIRRQPHFCRPCTPIGYASRMTKLARSLSPSSKAAASPAWPNAAAGGRKSVVHVHRAIAARGGGEGAARWTARVGAPTASRPDARADSRCRHPLSDVRPSPTAAARSRTASPSRRCRACARSRGGIASKSASGLGANR